MSKMNNKIQEMNNWEEKVKKSGMYERTMTTLKLGANLMKKIKTYRFPLFMKNGIIEQNNEIDGNNEEYERYQRYTKSFIYKTLGNFSHGEVTDERFLYTTDENPYDRISDQELRTLAICCLINERYEIKDFYKKYIEKYRNEFENEFGKDKFDKLSAKIDNFISIIDSILADNGTYFEKSEKSEEIKKNSIDYYMDEYKRVKKFKNGIKNQMDENSYMFVMAVINAYVSYKLKSMKVEEKFGRYF